jgi:pyrroloquinoline quinone biosynthesis protein B
LAWALSAGCAGLPAPDADGLVSAPGRSSGAELELIVLGVAQDGGLPQLGCNRPCCESARRAGRHLEPACLGVIDRRAGGLLLVEATPAIEPQVAMLQAAAGALDRGRRPVDAVLLTHAHLGHYLGLASFGREAAATSALPVHAAPRLQEFLRSNGPWSQLVDLHQIELRALPARREFAPLAGSDLLVNAIPVPHRGEFSETMAFQLRGPHRTVLFVPDVDRWDAQPDLLAELMSGVAVAYVDGTFFDGSELPDRNLAEIRHPFMTDTMAALADIARVRPGSVRFLHLNHSNPALHDPAVLAGLEARGFAVARQGERIGL